MPNLVCIDLYIFFQQAIFNVQEKLLIYSVLFTFMSTMKIFIVIPSNFFKNKSRNTVQGSLQIKFYFLIINSFMVIDYSSFYTCQTGCEHCIQHEIFLF